jgi:hypothetical protein
MELEIYLKKLNVCPRCQSVSSAEFCEQPDDTGLLVFGANCKVCKFRTHTMYSPDEVVAEWNEERTP